jgi:hypothetical protein
MSSLGVPLLIFAFAIYNILAFLLPGFSWQEGLLRVPTLSGTALTLSAGDAMVAAAILILLIEIVKSARVARRSLVDHLLSVVLFGGMLAEFLMVPRAVSVPFFLLLVTSFVDVVGGFAVARRSPSL